MSFFLTTEAVKRREKCVTRRIGWDNLKPGDRVRAVRKGMGLKKGEKVEPLAVIVVESIKREPLQRMLDDHPYGIEEAILEGFPGMTGFEFVTMFCKHHGVTASYAPNRIAFRYEEAHDA